MNVYKHVDSLKRVPYDRYLLYKKGKYPFLAFLDKYQRLKLLDILFETFSRPITLNCETTNTCTNNCIVCAYSLMKREKLVMPLERFEKLLHDYSDIGGGHLSFCPRGEVFLDPFLLRRVSILGKYPKIKSVSLTTNAVPLDMYSDEELRRILKSFIRIHISIYGLDREEYHLMTQRDFYARVVSNIKKIFQLIDKDKTSVAFGFRLLKAHSEKDIADWIKNNFDKDNILFGYTYSYNNWRGALKDPLPYEGKWQKRIQGKSSCLLPLVQCLIHSNGNVIYCPCTEFDVIEEFKLGNIDDQSLQEMFNSEKNKRLWASLPTTCLSCSNYHPITQPAELRSAFEDPLSIIGG